MGINIEMGTPKFTGRDGRSSGPIMWDPGDAISPHGVIVGSSGTGKTYRLRFIIGGMVRQFPGATIHILDVHGDIAPKARNRYVFSEATEYGLNPLEIEADPEFGGIRKRINAFIAMINRTSQKLGSRQEAVMRALLKELYEINGYDPKNARTWDPLTNPHARNFVAAHRRHPGIEQLQKLVQYRTENLIVNAGAPALKALNEVNKAHRKLQRLRKQGDAVEEPSLAIAKSNLKDLFCGYVDAIKTGVEFEELLNYDNVETMKAILERVKSLDDAGIFKDKPPVFDPSDPFRVYDIKALQEDEQKMFAEVLMERIFIEAKARGPRSYPDTFIVLDEAHKFMSPDNEHILNRMAREIRKFGVGLIIVSQNFDHFPEDIIANSAMTMILGMHDMHHDKAARKLGLERKRLSFIKPQQTALVQIRTRSTASKLTNSFTDVELPS